MATVRFSKELTKKIVDQAKSKMATAVIKAYDTKPDNKWGQHIYDTLFSEVKPFIAQFPAHWFQQVKQIQINVVRTCRCDLTFELAAPQPWPYQFIETDLAQKLFSFSDALTLKDHMVWDELWVEVNAYNKRVQAAINRQTEFVESVEKICNTYSTLAPALKAWPPLWELIPEDVKDKHRQVVEREKKEVKLEVDIDKLTALSTAAKFGV